MIINALSIGYLQMAHKKEMTMEESRKETDGLPKHAATTMMTKHPLPCK